MMVLRIGIQRMAATLRKQLWSTQLIASWSWK